MHPSTPRRRAHLHAPSGPGSLSASLFRQASAASQAATPAQKLAFVAILALFLIWNAATPGGDGGVSVSTAATAAVAGGRSGQLLSPAPELFRPGQPWLDAAGAPIQAHGGCIVRDPADGAFYWYGEDKSGGPTHVVGGNGDGSGTGDGGGTARVDVSGIAVYRATALTGPWVRLGLALKGGDGAHPDLDARAGVLERPAVVRRVAAGPPPPGGKTAHAAPASSSATPVEWVMWAHVDTADYSAARLGVAVSTTGPAGPFSYKGSFRPGGTHEARDVTLFQDDDGAAYVFYSSEGNRVMHISKLDASYTAISPKPTDSVRELVDLGREAPAVFKCGSWFYLLTSGCTGWAPNAAETFAARSPLGPWISLGSPAAGGSAAARARTFHSQPAAVVPAWWGDGGGGGGTAPPSSSSSSSLLWPPPRPDGSCAFIYAGDQWNVDDLGSSRYVWLPLWVVPLVEKEDTGAAIVLPPPRKAAPGAAKQQRKKGAAAAVAAAAIPADHPGTAVILQWAPAWGLGDLEGRPTTAAALAGGGPGRIVEI